LSRNGVRTMIKRINHITFAVSDLKQTASFYENVIGLKKTGEWSNYVIFDVGGVELAFEPGGKKGRKEGGPSIFMLVDNVDGEYKKLKEKGVKFASEPKDQYWGGRTATFLDPDGNTFILTQPKE
jgi:metallothiol transferase